MARIVPGEVGNYKRRDTDHVSADMRPKKEDYDRYIWLVKIGRQAGWNQAELLKTNPFRVADPTMTFICLRAARDLLETGEEFGWDTEGLRSDIASLEGGAASLWNE